MNEAEKSEEDELDAQLMADWEDIGGVGNKMTKEQLEHVATTMFGCPVANEDE
jgi:hypothetical protein